MMCKALYALLGHIYIVIQVFLQFQEEKQKNTSSS